MAEEGRAPEARILTLAEAEAALERTERGVSFAEQAAEWSDSLRLFLEHAWADGLRIPDRFVGGWHIDAICDHLEAVSLGDIRRLVVAVPPGSTKSTVASVCWPVWEWTRDPRRRFITASYDRELATKFSQMSRDLIQSDWFRARWPGVTLKSDENTKDVYASTKAGYRRSIPTRKGTGHHADVIVIDDPHDATEILSDAKRREVLEWHDSTVSRAFTDHSLGSVVIIAQRLHEKDLIGHVLEKDPGEWTVLCLPERYERRHPQRTPAVVKLKSGRELRGDRRTVEDELLCPPRVDERANARRQRDMTAFKAAGQLQQRPAPREGAIIKRAHWRYYPADWLGDGNRGLLPRFHALLQSWDTSLGDTAGSDYVCGGLWGLAGSRLYLLRVTRERLSLSGTKQAIRDMTLWVEGAPPKVAPAHPEWTRLPMRILVENQTQGKDVIAELQREIRGLLPVPVNTNKVIRAEAAEPAFESGCVYVAGASEPNSPAGYDGRLTPAWAQSVIEACAVFPGGDYDDEVDMVTQAVNFSRGVGQRRRARIGRASGPIGEQGSFVRPGG